MVIKVNKRNIFRRSTTSCALNKNFRDRMLTCDLITVANLTCHRHRLIVIVIINIIIYYSR